MLNRRRPPPSLPVATDNGGDMAVICCHFNWAHYKRPAQNLHRFLRQMKAAKIPVFGVEAILPGQIAQTQNMPKWKQIVADPGQQMMFQKERLLNIAEKHVPANFNKLAWVDPDVFFSNANWFNETSALLDHFPFVQPFDTAVWTNIDGTETFRRSGTLRMGGGMPCESHPGFAMASRRDLWKHCGGLFDKLIVGNGDVGIAAAVLGQDLPWTQTYSDELLKEYAAWMGKVLMHYKAEFGWVRGECWHEWHGSMKDRDYVERNRALKALKPEQHLWTGSNGLLSWRQGVPEPLRKYLRDYFHNRREDGGGSDPGVALKSTTTKTSHGNSTS